MQRSLNQTSGGMSDIRKLYQLQLLDQEIAARSAEQRDVEERLAGWPELTAAEERRTEARSDLASLERELRDLQAEVDDASAKVAREEQRLYGGEVRNPRELTSLQQEVTGLQTQRREREEQLLELLVRADEARGRLREQEAKVAELEAQWAAMKDQMQGQASEVAVALAQLNGQRMQLAQGVEPGSLSLYETLRAGRGQAVARIEQNRCQGCRVELPAAVVQRVRQDRQLTQCNHCNRLLLMM
jgi:predicted  nucleic acid-binding Zn-ribbon protein